ncbi:relaxase domain-containing protein [Streptomyces sp. NPDC001595]|uniref:relaxase domain-containing protein n=1 Tax=Streptomyces sp. NPDC001532 TaxID=3154520 RepID=UPI00332B7C78
MKPGLEQAARPTCGWGRGPAALGLTTGGDGEPAAGGAGVRAWPASGRRPHRARALGRRRRCGDGTAGHRPRPADRGDRETHAGPAARTRLHLPAQGVPDRAVGTGGRQEARRIIEPAHKRAVATVLRRLDDEVAETRWQSGRQRAKTPTLVVAAFRHMDNRDGLPLLHDHLPGGGRCG